MTANQTQTQIASAAAPPGAGGSKYPRYGIPDFDPIYERKQAGETLNPLEEFIFENEPAGTKEERDFCRELAALIEFVRSPGYVSSSGESR